MNRLLLYILILSIWNSFLFFNNNLGLNVILFIIPLLGFIVYSLSKYKKLVNKKGLLLMIPIILLSISYLIYDNSFFKGFNVVIISTLFLLTYIYTINPTYYLKDIVLNCFSLVFEPLSRIGNIFRLIGAAISERLKISDSTKKKIKSFIIIIPVIVVVLMLLSSADMMFGNIFSTFFDLIDTLTLSDEIFPRCIQIFILFMYMGCVTNYLLFGYKKDKYVSKEKVDGYTIKMLLIILNVIYVIFDIIQIRSLIFHHVSANIVYSEYARSGFFQLMFISFINLFILLISKKCKNKEYEKFNNIMSIIMVGLTLIIIISSVLRMHLYECAYGYTLLRLLVYVILFTETVLLIPTICYILNPKIKILKYYLIIITVVYTLVSLSPVDSIIANKNINRYYHDEKLDLDYLKNNCTDNIELLISLYNKCDDKNIKFRLEIYFTSLYEEKENDNILEFNISRNNALKEIEKLGIK